MIMPDLALFAPLGWRKSSYSGGGNQCVEVAAAAGMYAVRDSKNPAGGYLVFGGGEWQAFLAQIKQGRRGAS
jgi:Domain of unknown function (DUF397)